MAKLELSNLRKVISAAAEVVTEKANYNVEFNYSEKKVNNVSANVYDKERGEYKGRMTMDGEGAVSVSFTNILDGIEHLKVFSEIADRAKEEAAK